MSSQSPTETAVAPMQRVRHGRRHGLSRRPGGLWAVCSWWLTMSALLGIVVGVLWWLIAPGGAIYGDSTDFHIWVSRDVTLALLLIGAGVVSGIFALAGRGVRRSPAGIGTVDTSAMVGLLLAVSGLLGAVLAWRTGVFAGDLFRTPPANMPNPSIVFSLRSGSVLLLWPLASSAVAFIGSAISYGFFPSPEESDTGTQTQNPTHNQTQNHRQAQAAVQARNNATP